MTEGPETWRHGGPRNEGWIYSYGNVDSYFDDRRAVQMWRKTMIWTEVETGDVETGEIVAQPEGGEKSISSHFLGGGFSQPGSFHILSPPSPGPELRQCVIAWI